MSALPTVLAGDDFAISTRELRKDYGRIVALKKLRLQVPTGAVYLLVGQNGAGKSTTITILLDLIRPTGGTAAVLGLDPREQPALVRANVGYVPERLDWGYAWMRVGRLQAHHAAYYPSWDHDYATSLAHAFDLRPEQRMGTLSKGQGRRVHLLLALAHRPPVLILDEPTDGLDPVMRDETLAVLIDHVAQTPTTVLLCTHHPSEFETLADHVGVLRDNELRVQLSLRALQAGLRRYRVEIPVDWNGRDLFGEAALRRTTSSRDADWTVWGEERDVLRRFTESGAVVRDARSLSLTEAVLSMLSAKESAA